MGRKQIYIFLKEFFGFNRWKLGIAIILLLIAIMIGTQRVECVDCTNNFAKIALFPTIDLFDKSSSSSAWLLVVLELVYVYVLACLINLIFRKLKNYGKTK